MKPRRFRFGVSMATASSAVDWQAKARRAEGLGYSALLIPDHLADCLSRWTALTAAAMATDELIVGTFVFRSGRVRRGGRRSWSVATATAC